MDVTELVKRNHLLSLDRVLEGIGYASVRERVSATEVGAVIVALLGVASRDLTTTAHIAAFHRARGHIRNWGRADKFADDAVSACFAGGAA